MGVNNDKIPPMNDNSANDTLQDAFRLGYKSGYMAGRLDVIRGAEYDDLTLNERKENEGEVVD